jgi:hypothetical protein
MPSVYEELVLATAEDGASAPCGPTPSWFASEVDELMEAWLRERHRAIENRMFLDRACVLLSRIVAEGEVTPQAARSVKTLMRAIRDTERRERSQ